MTDFANQYEVSLTGVSTYNGEFFQRKYLVYAEKPALALARALDQIFIEHSELYKTSELVFCDAKIFKAEELRVI